MAQNPPIRRRVDCINKRDRLDPHDRIEAIGGVDGGRRWRRAEADAIADIESGRVGYYVERPAGHRVEVVVATRLGRKYLKTTADGERPDNLLALPECPR